MEATARTGGSRSLLQRETSSSCLHPSHDGFRYGVLLCSCMLTFGSYFCFDMPSTMKERLQEDYIVPWAPTSGLFQASFLYGLYYSLYAWTNALIGALFGGVIVDRYGTHFSTLLFCALYSAGQALFALGATLDGVGAEAQYFIMVIGRFIFGMGGGAITLVQNTISAQYFRHDRMALAMGFTLTASRVGSVINLNLTAKLVEATSVAATLWIGLGLCLLGASFGIGFIVLDRRQKSYSLSQGQEAASVTVKKVSLRDVGRLPLQLWLVALVISLYYIMIFAFMAIAKDFFEAKWNSNQVVVDGASFRSSVVYLMGMAFMIFAGACVDAVGNRPCIMFLTCAFSVAAFLLLQCTMLDPVWGMLLLGLTYMFAASSMWPCIPLVVPIDLVGTANGVATSVQMMGIALANMLVGILQDASPKVYPGTSVKDYSYCMFFFAACGVAACAMSLALNAVDARSGGVLNNRKEKSTLVPGATANRETLSSSAEPSRCTELEGHRRVQ
eukprot:TRINITY_DN50036_c0_g1_i1.p1 TRINITY_DN50036_c0_g1~~TRINITY_DN50036_c0_g1_i1.p1  ORF type:complete len:515 (-),score=73.57 TRINITY_DN50036_c0_g1_i1:75-1577(-)